MRYLKSLILGLIATLAMVSTTNAAGCSGGSCTGNSCPAINVEVTADVQSTTIGERHSVRPLAEKAAKPFKLVAKIGNRSHQRHRHHSDE